MVPEVRLNLSTGEIPPFSVHGARHCRGRGQAWLFAQAGPMPVFHALH